MALSITVHGQGTFTASMEEGPVTFTAAIASVGPQGATGPTGPAGVVAATAPITYNAGTQTVGISATPTFTSVTATTVNLTTATFADATSQTTAFVGEARKVYVTGRNSTGSTIAKGKVVYLSGGTGNVPNIALALADSEATSARTIGITAEAIANNANGKVIISGAVENIDTSAFSDGDTVYLSATTAGGLTTTLPAAPLHGVVIGIVTRANPSVGSIEVSINNYQELKELSDVNVGDRANNDGLFWDSSSSTWRSKTVAEVLGYTPANGADYLAKADNLSGLASASTARTNLGLGTMAVETASDYLTKAGNLSGLASASTARTNLGLGTMATETAANYALLASPALTGTPTAPTAAAATNTTQIATTAFVNAYCPAASDTTAGKVQLATVAEAVAGTDPSKAVTAEGVKAVGIKASRLSVGASSWSAATSGTGAGTAQNGNQKQVAAPTTATGYGSLYYNFLVTPLQAYNSNIDWSKRFECEFHYSKGVNTTDANTVGRVKVGQPSFNGVAGDLAARGIGIRHYGNGNIFLTVHNGTTLTAVDSGISASVSTMRLILKLVSDGAGNVTLYSNGTQVATTNAGPTSSGGGNGVIVEAQNLATISTTPMQVVLGNFTADFGY